MGRRNVPKIPKKIHSSDLRTHYTGNTARYSFERLAEEKEALESSPFAYDPRDCEVYDPPEKKRITKEGGWAMILMAIPVQAGEGIKENVRPGRIFYIEHDEGADEYGFGPSGRYKVITKTPWGTVWMWPYEYSVMTPELMISLWQAEEIIFNPTNMEIGRFNDVVHYVRSRGVGVADAMVMALGTLKGNVGWFSPAEHLVQACEEMVDRFNNWKPRRTISAPMNIKLEISKAEVQLEKLK